MELHTDLTETAFVELLKSARERNMRPLMFDHHHIGSEKDLYAVLANDQTGDWAVSLRISGAHLARLIPAVEALGARAGFMASTASSGEVVYRVLWRGNMPEALADANEETKAAGPQSATAMSVFKLPTRPQVVTPEGTPISAIHPFDSETALRSQEAWAKHLQVPAEYINSIGVKSRLIPLGNFRMASTPEEAQKANPLPTERKKMHSWNTRVITGTILLAFGSDSALAQATGQDGVDDVKDARWDFLDGILLSMTAMRPSRKGSFASRTR